MGQAGEGTGRPTESQPSFAGHQAYHTALAPKLAAGQRATIAMPEIPDPPPSKPALPSAESASPALPSQHHGVEASVRLLLEALVRRLQRRPLELAERAVGKGGD